MWLSGDFHDAYIADISEIPDGIKVWFKGIWGCELEISFTEDVSYQVGTRLSYEYNPYWFDSTMLIENGYIYLFDEKKATVDKINEDFCWFRARHVTYRVIPED